MSADTFTHISARMPVMRPPLRQAPSGLVRAARAGELMSPPFAAFCSREQVDTSRCFAVPAVS